MNNEDMTRFYEVGTDLGRPGDFVRRDKDGNVPGSMKLNKYTVSKPSLALLKKIMLNCKGHYFGQFGYNVDNTLSHCVALGNISISTSGKMEVTTVTPNHAVNSTMYIVYFGVRSDADFIGYGRVLKINGGDGTFAVLDMPQYNPDYTNITYYNDIEITL